MVGIIRGKQVITSTTAIDSIRTHFVPVWCIMLLKRFAFQNQGQDTDYAKKTIYTNLSQSMVLVKYITSHAYAGRNRMPHCYPRSSSRRKNDVRRWHSRRQCC